MKTLIHTFFTCLLLTTFGQLMGQRSFLMPIGTSMETVQANLMSLPQFEHEFVGAQQLVFGNEFIYAKYRFGAQGLEKTTIEHNYRSAEISRAEFESYIRRFHKMDALVVPIFDEKKVAVYSVYTHEQDIEIMYRKYGPRDYQLKISVSPKENLPAQELEQHIFTLSSNP